MSLEDPTKSPRRVSLSSTKELGVGESWPHPQALKRGGVPVARKEVIAEVTHSGPYTCCHLLGLLTCLR